jgi:hypothetical protein
MSQVYVVRDQSGEYLSDKCDGGRTPASDEAKQFTSREEAQCACERATDRVLVRDVEQAEEAENAFFAKHGMIDQTVNLDCL